MTAYWLMKTEPTTYGIDHLVAENITPWEGVRNYQARNFMRDDMRVGGQVLFYHSNCKTARYCWVGRSLQRSLSRLFCLGYSFEILRSKINPRQSHLDDGGRCL